MTNPGFLLLSGSGQPFINSSITFNLTSAVPPSFTLGCISTSGPPTVVSWTRDGIPLPMDSNHVLTQTLVNPVTATYYNNLTVNRIFPGLYRCTVTSIKPVISERLSASQEVTIDGKCSQQYYCIVQCGSEGCVSIYTIVGNYQLSSEKYQTKALVKYRVSIYECNLVTSTHRILPV